MLSIAALKLFGGVSLKFVKKYFIPVLIVTLALTTWYYYAKADRVQFEYDQHFLGDAAASSQRKLENHLKEQAHKKEVDKANAESKAQLEKYKLDRDRETKRLKDLYENRIDTTGRNWSERVRLEQEREAATGLPTPTSDTSGYTEGLRECYTAYITLENACRITTIDFNNLRTWGDSVCDLVGCK